YPVAAFAVGNLAGDGRRYGRLFAATLAGLALIHLGGLAQLLILTGGARGAVRLGTAPFLLSDAGKLAIAVLVLRHTMNPLRARTCPSSRCGVRASAPQGRSSWDCFARRCRKSCCSGDIRSAGCRRRSGRRARRCSSPGASRPPTSATPTRPRWVS